MAREIICGVISSLRRHAVIRPGNKPRRAVAGGERKAQKRKTARFGHERAEPGQSLRRAVPAGL